jgi:hypothetical protein
MKTSSNYGNASASRAEHKIFQNRWHGVKTGTHRQERRKVREYLRHAGSAAGFELEQ